MLRVAGQTGTVTVLQQTAREHNNPPALIKKQMMIEPTHNSRYSNNNNNKLYTTNNREHKTQKQKTNRDTHESKAKPKELLFVREYVLERTFRSELLDEEAGKGRRRRRREPMIIAHIEKHFLYLHYICIMQATCMTWNAHKQSSTHTHTHKYKHNHTHVRTHIDTQALMHNM